MKTLAITLERCILRKNFILYKISECKIQYVLIGICKNFKFYCLSTDCYFKTVSFIQKFDSLKELFNSTEKDIFVRKFGFAKLTQFLEKALITLKPVYFTKKFFYLLLNTITGSRIENTT